MHDEIQSEMNSPTSSMRLLLASMRVGGLGLNFQMDSHTAILFDAPDTLGIELQVIGRQHRMG
jgi:SNF2 family DNA or RNA helicase